MIGLLRNLTICEKLERDHSLGSVHIKLRVKSNAGHSNPVP